MSAPAVEVTLSKLEFAPGESLTGTLRWGSGNPPAGLRLVLGFHTEGKGTTDHVDVDEQSVSAPQRPGEFDFRFALPAAPYTFDGALISLRWHVNAVVGRDRVQAAFTFSPWVETVRLQAVKEAEIPTPEALARLSKQ